MQNFDISSKVVVSGGIFPWLIYETVLPYSTLEYRRPWHHGRNAERRAGPSALGSSETYSYRQLRRTTVAVDRAPCLCVHALDDYSSKQFTMPMQT